MRPALRWAAAAFLAAAAGPAAAAVAPPPYLVADLDTRSDLHTGSSDPVDFRRLGDRTLFFAGRSPYHLGVTDGTTEGTRLLAALCAERSCEAPEWLTAEGEPALFSLDGRPFDPGELWGTDGTEAGTVLLLRTDDGAFGPDSSVVLLGTFLGRSWALLEVRDPSGSTAVWRSDGTAAGTVRLADLPGEPVGTEPAARLGDRLVFVHESLAYGRELWATDGTPAGTALLLDLLPGPHGSDPSGLTGLGGDRVVFAADGLAGRHLYVTDGTAAGSDRLTDPVTRPIPKAVVDGRVLVLARQSELWATDGTREGTVQLISGLRFIREPFAVAHGLAFFRYSPEDGATENLWATDGTPAGTGPLTDLVDGPHVAVPEFSFDLGATRVLVLSAAGRVFFQAWEPAFGTELWTTDGTPAGTSRVVDLCPGACDGGIRDLETGPHALAFSVESSLDGEDRYQLWVTDGTGPGTRSVRGGSRPPHLGPWIDGTLFFASFDEGLLATEGTVESVRRIAGVSGVAEWGRLADGVGERLLFSAAIPGEGVEPWISDGTSAGTAALADLEPNAGGSSSPHRFFEHRGRLVFHARDQVWRSDGRAEGTVPLPEAVSATAVGDVLFLRTRKAALRALHAVGAAPVPLLTDASLATELMVDLGGRALFFARGPGASTTGLWISDGTAAGTVLVRDGLSPTGGITFPEMDLATTSPPSPRALFFARTPDGAESLWSTDGTPAGTVPVPLPGLPSPRGHDAWVRPVAGRVLIAAGGFDRGVWLSDGTAAGTRLLARTPRDAEPDVAEVDGIAYFPLDGGELWRTDGTPGGTRRVAGAEETGWLDEPAELHAFGDRLVFVAEEAELGRELWVSDGTPGGTRPLVDLWPGPAGSRPAALSVVGDRLYFGALDAAHGRELWVTDGTVGGTRRVSDVAPGPASSSPSEITAVGDLLFFRANDRVHGHELWAWRPAVEIEPCRAGDAVLCLGAEGRFAVRVEWRDPRSGASGVGRTVPVEGSHKSGAFWFFAPHNLELLVKVLDGGPVNGYHWVFWGGLSDVEYTIVVTDHESGAVRTYRNPPGRICGGADTAAFDALRAAGAAGSAGPVRAAGAPARRAARLAAPATAATAADSLLLASERFRVEVAWRDQRTGATGTGLARPVTGNTGFFSFFDPANVELVVKVLDGRPVNGHHWVFWGALTDVEYTLTVTDTDTGDVATYHNPPGEICGGADTAAF